MTVQTASRSPDRSHSDGPLKIGVVDPSSGGYFIARRILERGFECVAISSSGVTSSDLNFTAALHAGDTGFETDVLRHDFHALIPGAESGVRLCESLAKNLGLKGNDPTTTEQRRSKTVMAQAVRAAGIALCRQARCNTTADCLAWADSIGFPIVIKPEASSGSDLVKVCQTQDELLAHAALILSGRDKYGQNTQGVLLQEFMVGDEYTVDGVVTDGKLTIFAVGRYRKINRDGSMIYDKIDFFPPNHPSLDPRLLTYCEAVTHAVGARVGPVHIEVMLTEDGPLLVEIAARAHGGIGTSVIDANFRPSFIDAIIDAYLPGETSALSAAIEQKKAASIAFLISDRPGTLKSMPGASFLASLPSFVRMKQFVQPGEDIARTIDLATCPALVELAHPDPAVIEADILRIRATEQAGKMLEVE
ncbi:ATP-grasp domain-containing protein [Allorhizobium undicola]|uniref:ATP-grasp domain-containing protein n=1 Tax=Allorhizobium undicola TaxID=78527 RepID=UPI003D3406CB